MQLKLGVKFFILGLMLISSAVLAAVPPVIQVKISNNSNVPIVQLTGSLQILSPRNQFCVHTNDINGAFKVPIMPQSSHIFSYTYGSFGVCAIQDKYQTVALRIDSVNRQAFADQILCQISHEMNRQGQTLHYAGSEIILSFSAGKWTCSKL